MAKSPRISGFALRVVAGAARFGPLRRVLVRTMRKDLGISALAGLEESVRGRIPLPPGPVEARTSHERPSAGLGPLPIGDWPRTVASYERAFATGDTTPREVTERAVAAARSLAEARPAHGPIHVFDEAAAMRDSEEATRRHAEHRPLGPLDGVPVVVKEEVDVRGLPTRLGTGFMPLVGAGADATAVARLRASGAVVLGHSPMTEYGLSPLGVNPHRPMPRNPHDSSRLAGGSSTGSGVAVATGVVPVAIGADGGGSIRTPASHLGVFGLKTTYGRVSRHGHGIGGTLAVLGPIASSSTDLAVVLEAISGDDPEDPLTSGRPAPVGEMREALGRGVSGLRIGVDDGEWVEADCSVSKAGRAALAALEKEGAILVPVAVKLARHAASMGYVTIGLEAYADLRDVRLQHMRDLAHDLRINFRALGEFTPGDYLDAQRLRAGLREEVARVLLDVDVLALPSVGCTALRVTDAEVASGFLDAGALHAHCRFAFLANLTGLPAGSAPVGTDAEGLPIGLQIVGDGWDEAAVLQVLAHLERMEVARVVRPKVSVDLLGAAGAAG